MAFQKRMDGSEVVSVAGETGYIEAVQTVLDRLLYGYRPNLCAGVIVAEVTV